MYPKLRRNKSVGPDKIPNEMFLESTDETRKLFRETLNKINSSEEIHKGLITKYTKEKDAKETF